METDIEQRRIWPCESHFRCHTLIVGSVSLCDKSQSLAFAVCLFMDSCETDSEVEGDRRDQSQPAFLYMEL
jgi:hypothetical protein